MNIYIYIYQVVYQGVYGYNSRWVKEPLARQVACETTPRVPPVPKEDRVVFHVSDMHNTGCTNQSGAARGPARLESWVEVRNVDDAPTVVLLKAGADVCGVCARTPAGIR